MSSSYLPGSDEQTCPECGGSLVTEGIDVVCEECGAVTEERNLDRGPEWRAFSHEEKQERSRVGAPTTNTLHDKGLTTSIDWKDRDGYGNALDQRQRWRAQRLRKQHEQREATDRTLSDGLREINRITSVLALPQTTEEMASKLFRRVQNEGLLHGRTVEGVAAGTVALANQIDGPFRQYAEIASVSQVSKKKCLDVVRMLQQEFDIEVEVAHPRAYVDRIVSDLGIAAQVGKGVHELLEGVDNKIIFDGRKPSGTAAAAVYAVADGLGIDVTQQEIAKAAEVCPATIRKQYKELYKEADMDLVQ